MSRGGASGFLVPSKDSALRIWNTLKEDTYEESGIKSLEKRKGSGNTFADVSVECDASNPLVYALFLQTFFAKWGFVPDIGKDEIIAFRGLTRKKQEADKPMMLFMEDVFDFEEALLDYINDRVYTEAHTEKMCSELTPPLIGQANVSVPLVSRITRMGNSACGFPSSMELIDIVGNVIRIGIQNEIGKQEDFSYLSRNVEMFSTGPMPVMFISKAPLSDSYRRNLGGPSNAGLSAFIGPDVTIKALHSGQNPYITEAQRTLLLEDYQRFFKDHRSLRTTVKAPERGAPLQEEKNEEGPPEDRAVIPVGFYEMGDSTSPFSPPSSIRVALVPARDALLKYYRMERAKNRGNLA
tara:strand:- start:954 stop:2012 length:1059 start_codon:yes stop_codon:yes gene_type:complete